MNKAFIDAVQQTINARYHLSRDKKEWILEENDLQTQTRVRAPTKDSIAFSLEKRCKTSLARYPTFEKA